MTVPRPPELTDEIIVQAAVGLAAIALVAGLVGGLFFVDFGSETQDPVDFDRTVTVGLTLEDELRLEDEDEAIELPRMQVFYSQYPYVVGYYGVGSFVTERREPAHEQQFGFPIATYVTDYSDRGVELNEEGIPRTRIEPGWVEAETAVYVIDSEARSPSGAAVLPFSSRGEADEFIDEYGGTVVEWEEILETEFESNDAAAVRDRVGEQHRSADATVADRSSLRDRPVETVVGEDAATVQEAVDVAPPETTVVVPEGVYNETVEIDRPITVRGVGDARLRGDNNGTVLTVTANRTAIVGMSISGVGDATPGPTVTDDHAHGGFSGGGGHDHGDADGDDTWDADVEDDYAQGDTAISVETASDVLIDETEIDTSAAGIILRDSPGAVVRNSTVVGSDNYRDGHMGVVAMRSPGIVEESTFVGGLDGVYTHRAEGTVVRNNELRENRMGIHLMFTSGALLANNTITDSEDTGIYVMTGPQRNGLVGNEITDTPTAISIGGTDSYVADNVLTDNWLGVRIDATASIIERNVIADNRDGVETWALLPTNRVTHNDFVGNERHVSVSSGRLRVWTHDGEGNYWEGAIGTTDGTVIQRPYTPTDPVDGQLHRTDGAKTLAQAPALDALAGFSGAVPGMRADEVIDIAPRCSPVNEAWFERTGKTDTEPVCRSDGREEMGS